MSKVRVINLTDAAPHPLLVARTPTKITIGEVEIDPGQVRILEEDTANYVQATFKHHLCIGSPPHWYSEWKKDQPKPKKATKKARK